MVFSYLLCLLIVSRHVFNCITYLLKVYRHVGMYNNYWGVVGGGVGGALIIEGHLIVLQSGPKN